MQAVHDANIAPKSPHADDAEKLHEPSTEVAEALERMTKDEVMVATKTSPAALLKWKTDMLKEIAKEHEQARPDQGEEEG